jgi:hypothetical protein
MDAPRRQTSRRPTIASFAPVDHPAVAPQEVGRQGRPHPAHRHQAGQEVQIGDRGGPQGPVRRELAGVVGLLEHGRQVAGVTRQIDQQHPPAIVGQGDPEGGAHPRARVQIGKPHHPRLAKGGLEHGGEAAEEDAQGLACRSLELQEAPAHPEPRRQDADHGQAVEGRQ